MSYKDMTFCPFWEECSKGCTCPRALTESVKEDAIAWGGKHAPICVYRDAPHCFAPNPSPYVDGEDFLTEEL